MSHLDNHVTLLPNIFKTHVFEPLPLREMLERLERGEWSDQVEHVQALAGEAQKEAKRALPAFAPSATFKRTVTNDDMDVHSGVVVIDYDNVGDPWRFIKHVCEPLPYALAAWPSTRGNGVKLLVALNVRPQSPREHRAAFLQVCEALDVSPQEEAQGDVRRLCFVSAPGRVWINENVRPFEWDASQATVKPERAAPVSGMIRHGEQHNTLVREAGRMRRYGYSPNEIFAALWQMNIERCEKPGTEEAIRKIADSAERWEPESHVVTAPEPVGIDADAPAIPERVYDLIPESWRTACDHFDRWHERDVFLTGLVGTLSSVLSIVRFQYGKAYHSPHLFLFIIAQAASGKGVLEHAFRWIDGIDEHLIEESTKKRREWEEKKREYERSLKRKDVDSLPDPGPPPPERFLRTAEDATLPELYESLQGNAPEGLLMASTEADAVSGANARDWGGFTHLLRRAFHHESTRKATKTDGRVRLKRPRMAVVLSGTEDQYGRLVEDIHNGTHSRFGALRFSAPMEYVSQRPTDKDIAFEAFIERQQTETFRLWEILQLRRETVERGDETYERPKPLYFDVSPELWERIDAPFRALFNRLFREHHAPAMLAANVKRGALIAFRIAAVIATWRAFESGRTLSTANRIEATDADIEAACALGLVYAEHAIRQALAEMARKGSDATLPDTDDVGGVHRMTGRMRTFLEALPATFTADDAERVGEDIGVSRPTVYRYLDRLQEQDQVSKRGHGKYEKRVRGKPDETLRLRDFGPMEARNGESLKNGKSQSLIPDSGVRLPQNETFGPNEPETAKVSKSQSLTGDFLAESDPEGTGPESVSWDPFDPADEPPF